MDTRPIRTDKDYEAALAEIERLLDAAPGSPRDVTAWVSERRRQHAAVRENPDKPYASEDG